MRLHFKVSYIEINPYPHHLFGAYYMKNCIIGPAMHSPRERSGHRPNGSILFLFCMCFILLTGPSTQAQQPFIGQIKLFAGNFAPAGWADCDGSLLAISSNEALFSLIGTTYGGDGQNTFALPDLRGRVAVGIGQGPGLSNYTIGQQGGAEAVTLTQNQLPAHTHALQASTTLGSTDSPTDAFPARSPDGSNQYAASGGASMPAGALGNTGGSQPHNNVKPYLALRYIISLYGIYPSRN